MSRIAGAVPVTSAVTVVAPRVMRTVTPSQTAGLGDVLGDLLGFGDRAEAAAGRVDRRRGGPLGDVAAVQVDAGLNDPQGEQHQQAEQDGPLRALTEAALVAGPSAHGSDLAELG